MIQNTTYTARDGEIFDNHYGAKYHDFSFCTKENEAFVVMSSFYGQFRGIFKEYSEAIDFTQSQNEKMIVERIDIGNYRLEKLNARTNTKD